MPLSPSSASNSDESDSVINNAPLDYDADGCNHTYTINDASSSPPWLIDPALIAVVRLLKEFWFSYYPCHLVKRSWASGIEARAELESSDDDDDETLDGDQLGLLPLAKRVHRLGYCDIDTPNPQTSASAPTIRAENVNGGVFKGQPVKVLLANRKRAGLEHQCHKKKDVRARFLKDTLQRAGGPDQLVEAVDHSWEHLLIEHSREPTDAFLFEKLIFLSQPTDVWKLRLPSLSLLVYKFASLVSDPPAHGIDIALEPDQHKVDRTNSNTRLCGHWTSKSWPIAIARLVKETFKECPLLGRFPNFVTKEVIAVSAGILRETIYATDFLEEHYRHDICMSVFDLLSPELTCNVHERITQQALYSAINVYKVRRKCKIRQHLQSLYHRHSLGEIWTPTAPPRSLLSHHGRPSKSTPTCESPAGQSAVQNPADPSTLQHSQPTGSAAAAAAAAAPAEASSPRRSGRKRKCATLRQWIP